MVSAAADIRREDAEESLKELASLTETAEGDVVDTLLQMRSGVDSKYYIGKGKLEFLKTLCEEHEADVLIFDDELTAAQQKNIQKLLPTVRLLDRSGLILHIFQLHARTREAKTQVELALLEYMLPRLTRQWTHLERQMGGVGGARRGVGETQIELDRRMIRKKIAQLKEELKNIAQQRETKRKFRSRHFNVALVGYTNAGKSTLMNLLTEAGVGVEDKLFATLDTTVRLLEIDRSHSVYLSDTVGFIQKLPHPLVASFRSTLKEVESADLLLKVIDVSDSNFRSHIRTIDEVLTDFQIPAKRSLTLFNKIDSYPDSQNPALLRREYPDAIMLSALRHIGTDKLLDAIRNKMDENSLRHRVKVPHGDGKLTALLHSQADILSRESDEEHSIYEILCEPGVLSRLQKNHGLICLDEPREEMNHEESENREPGTGSDQG